MRRSSRYWGRPYLTAALLMLSAGCDDVLPSVDLDDYLDGGAEQDAAQGESADEDVPDEIKQPAEGVYMATKMVDGKAAIVTRSGGLSIPEGALSAAAEVTVSEVEASDIKAQVPRVLEPVAPATAFTPHGMKFEQPVTLTLFYEADRSKRLVALRLDDENDTSWEVVEATFENNTAFVKSSHFSIYTVTGCDPDNDPDGFCSDLSSGSAKLEDVPASDFVTFEPPPVFGGSTTPPREEQPPAVADAGVPEVMDAAVDERPDAGADTRPDAAVDAKPDASVDTRPDGAVPPPDAGAGRDAGGGVTLDGSVPTRDAGAAEPGDAGTRDGGEQACSWYEVCGSVEYCIDSAGNSAPMEPTGACPANMRPTKREECHLEPRCTPEWCAVHPSDCTPIGDAGTSVPVRDGGVTDYDASVPDYDARVPAYDAGTGVDVDAALPPECRYVEECYETYQCRPGSQWDAGSTGNCELREVCHERPCDVPPVCGEVCGEERSCDPNGENCTSKPYCRVECQPSSECPPPVCGMEEVCGPAAPCNDADLELVRRCQQYVACDRPASESDAGLPTVK